MEMCCFRRVSLEGLMRTFLTLLDVNIVLWAPRPVSGQTVGEMEWGIKGPPRKLKAKPASRPQPLITSLPQLAVNWFRQDSAEPRKLPSPPHRRVVSLGSRSQFPPLSTLEVKEPSGAFQLSPPNEPTSPWKQEVMNVNEEHAQFILYFPLKQKCYQLLHLLNQWFLMLTPAWPQTTSPRVGVTAWLVLQTKMRWQE